MEVNVQKILESKSPSLARIIPSFIINYLRKIVHQEEVNRYLKSYQHLPSLEFIRATLKEMNIEYHAEGMDKLNKQGRYIFASNHPFGGLDGLMLADIVGSYFGDARVIVNDILMNLDPLKDIFVPINKHGRQNQQYSQMFNATFESEMPIITFPAGLCSRRTHGVVCDTEWKHNFVKQAIRTQRDIVPVYFEGELSNFFYTLSNIRKRLGIKANLEMLYLADEMFLQSGRSFTIRIGEPVSWSDIAQGSPREWAQTLRQNTYSLKK